MKRLLLTISIILISLALFPRDYVYVEHYPVLSQPWYFSITHAIDVGPNGNLYVVHSSNIVSVFSPDGVLLKQYRFFVDLAAEKNLRRSIFAIAVDPSGNIYLADFLEGRLLKVNPQGEIVRKFHGCGWRGDLETDSSGNLYFADTNANDSNPWASNDSIFKFDPDGNILMSFGGVEEYWNPESWDEAAPSPRGIGLDSHGNIFVAYEDKVKKYDSEGKYIGSFGEKGEGPGQLNYPNDIEIDHQGNIYIKDSLKRIQKFSSSFEFILQWGSVGTGGGEFHSVKSAKILQNRIYVFDGNARIQAFNLNGEFMFNWQPMGHEEGRFWRPKRVAVDNPGNIYVLDSGNSRIQKFDRKWKLEMVLGSEGGAPGQFKNPSGIVVDDEGNIYVADMDNHRVQKFNKRGEFVMEWGEKGTGEGKFEKLVDIDADKDGYIYTLDESLKYVSKFTRNGAFVMRFKATDMGSTNMTGFCVDSRRVIYITGYDAKVHMYSTDGVYMGRLADWDKLRFPTDVAVSPAGEIFVADIYKGVARFDTSGRIIEYIAADNDPIESVYFTIAGIAVGTTGKLYILEEMLGRILVYAPKAGQPMTLSAAASAVGANATRWRTDLYLFNRGEEMIDLNLSYLKGGDKISATLSLPPLFLQIVPDVIAELFSSPDTFGAIVSTNLEATEPLISSRTYNLTGEGTFGQGIRGSPLPSTLYQGERGYLIGLKRNLDFRSNVGFVNLYEDPLEISARLYGEDGTLLAEGLFPLSPFSHFQINNIFSALGLDGDYEGAWMELWSDTLNGRFSAYGSVVDNQSGDPVYIEADKGGGYSPEKFDLILPVAVSSSGAYGTYWKTELIIANPSVEESEVEVIFHPSDGSGPRFFEAVLESNGQIGFNDLLSDAFSLSESFGFLEVKTQTAGLQVRGRIYTGDGATFGQGVRAVRRGLLPSEGEALYLLNLVEDGTYRSNLGIVNLSDEDGVFNLELIKGGEVVSNREVTISAGTLHQENNILSTLFQSEGVGFVLRVTPQESIPFLSYLSTVDNRTGDAVFQIGS